MILVTGATGFLGSFICRELLAKNYQFVALKRPESDLGLVSDIAAKIEWVEGDIMDMSSLASILPKIDIVIHAAAIVSFHASDKEKMLDVNVEGTKNLVNLCLTHQVKKLIHISSVAALGRNIHSGTVDENNKWQNSKLNTNYAESKYYAELEVWRGMEEGLHGVILNPSVILGPGDWNRSSSALFKYIWDEHKFYVDGWVNYVDVRDVTDLVIKVLDNPDVIGHRFIINAGKISFKELFDQIAKRFKKSSPSIKAGRFMLYIGLWAEWLRGLVTGSRPMVTKETTQISKTKIYFDNSKVVQTLNHTFVPLEETLDWACAQYLKNKN